MERSVAYVPRDTIVESKADKWAGEIRDYLIGRLSKQHRIEVLPEIHTFDMPHVPVRRWWIFEGKRYNAFGGALANNWLWVVKNAWRLREMFNPRLRLSDRPDGVVDWAQTLARGPQLFRSEYVIRSSGIGLNEEEDATLRGWARWIADEWREYAHRNGMDTVVEWGSFATDEHGPFTIEQLRRWAHTARRSRWPLLRDVVAETLRPVLEAEDLDRIPLPSAEAKLFELICLVRIARCISPVPRELRWLGAEINANTISFDGTRVYYQEPLERDRVLATYEHDGALRVAVERFGLGIPTFIDLAFDFEQKWRNFDGLIVEAKSGSQQYEKTLAQLRTYRAARTRRPGTRYLVWGIIESLKGPDRTSSDLQRILSLMNDTDDAWVFSTADAIPMVMDAVFGPVTERACQ